MADLNFLGYGAGYNPALGPNSAYFMVNKDLYLLDCGTSVFERLADKGILKQVNKVTVFLTHQHADHVGSLGILLDYCWDILQLRPLLVHPVDGPVKLMEQMGVSPEAFCWSAGETYGPDANHVAVRFLGVEHAPDIPSYGLVIDAAGDRFYYSGDANDVPPEVVDALTEGRLDRIYQDTASRESAYHCGLQKLCRRIPPEYRQKVTCMHLDGAQDPAAIRQAGFRIAGDII